MTYDSTLLRLLHHPLGRALCYLLAYLIAIQPILWNLPHECFEINPAKWLEGLEQNAQADDFVFTPGKVIGATWYIQNGFRRNFMVNMEYDKGAFTATLLRYLNHSNRLFMQATSINEFLISGVDVKLKGNCKVNDVAGYSFEMDIKDVNPDFIALNIKDGTGKIVDSTSGTAAGGDFIVATYNVINTPPVIESIPNINAKEGELYTYDVEAVDTDAGDILKYLLVKGALGMTIDPSTGLIQWVPMTAQIGNNDIIVQVEDKAGAKDIQSFTIAVENVEPTITSSPIVTATEGSIYIYDVNATDPGLGLGDVLTYSLTTSPTGMLIDSATGLIQWTPTAIQIGNKDVVAQVTDKTGAKATQSFTIAVANVPPSITSTSITKATEGALYTYDVDATDPGAGDILTYSLTTYPTSIIIDTVTGLIQWTPTSIQVGDNPVIVQVADLAGAKDTQSFTITVVNVPPQITSNPVTTANEGVLYTYDVEATESGIAVGDVLTYSLTTAPAGMTIDASTGLIQWMPTKAQEGDNSVAVQVEDLSSAKDTQSFTITVFIEPWKIISIPITTATEGALYTYDVETTDLGVGNVLTYSFTTAPVGMTIEPSTGLIQWTPTAAQVDVNNVDVQVIDKSGTKVTQFFTVTVANVPPDITSTPILTGTERAIYSYDVDAIDPGVGDVLTYSLTTKPTGMTIDSATGLIQWTPTNSQVGDNNVGKHSQHIG